MTNNRPTLTQGTTAPANPRTGDVWVDSYRSAAKRYNGTTWEVMHNVAGAYVPEGSLDRWSNSYPGLAKLRNVVVVGDSVTQGGAGGATRNVTDLNTTINTRVITSATAAFTSTDRGSKIVGTNIPLGAIITTVDSATQVHMNVVAYGTTSTGVLTIQAECFVDRLRTSLQSRGFYTHNGWRGPWRGDFYASWVATTDHQEFRHTKAFAQGSALNTYSFGPYGIEYVAPATSASNVAVVGATMTTVNASKTVNFTGTSLNSTDHVGCLLSGPNIPPNTFITAVNSTTQVVVDKAATAGASAQNFRIEGPLIVWRRPLDMDATDVGIVWIDQSNSATTFSYSVDGGTNWIDITQTAANPPKLNTTWAALNGGDTIMVRGYNSGSPNVIGNYARFTFVGFLVHGFSLATIDTAAIVAGATPDNQATGIAVHNLGYDGNQMANFQHSVEVTDLVTNGTTAVTSASAPFRKWRSGSIITGTNITAGTTWTYVSDTSATLSAVATGSGTNSAVIGSAAKESQAWLHNSQAGTWPGMAPDLIIVMFTNDYRIVADAARYTDHLSWLKSKVGDYCDMIVLGCYEQSGGRDVTDAVTNGTTTVTSATANFQAGDVGKVVSGTNIPSNNSAGAPVTIATRTNTTTITISVAASGSASGGTFSIDGSPTIQQNYRTAIKAWCAANNAAYLDLYEAWAARVGTAGYTAANAAGLMQDVLHPSNAGHRDIASRIARLLSVHS